MFRFILAEEISCLLLSRTFNLSDQDNAVTAPVAEEDFEVIDEVYSREGIAADANNEELSEPGLGGLVYSLRG